MAESLTVMSVQGDLTWSCGELFCGSMPGSRMTPFLDCPGLRHLPLSAWVGGTQRLQGET